MLSEELAQQFVRDGYCLAPGAVSPEQLARLQGQIVSWVEDSRAHDEPFGLPTIDGRPRFDMGSEHTATNPALRRINNPSDVSDAYLEVMSDAPMVDMVAQLVGANVKFHHCKINLKLPGSNTEVGYHQDFAYTPHTNDDIVTALLLLDDMTPENGCLQVVPGSHLGPVYSLFDDDTFVGVIEPERVADVVPQQVPIYGPAGSVCLMHTRLIHGSDANRSQRSRGLYICVYSAADAFPLAANPMPSPNEGKIVRGVRTRSARLQQAHIELPEQPKSASFFTVIGQASKGNTDDDNDGGQAAAG
jgi:hypothetical protein